VPCCPRDGTAPTTRARMKEYFDLGRGHERVGERMIEAGCRICRFGVDGDIVGDSESIYGPHGYGGGYEPAYTPPIEIGGGGTYAAQAGGRPSPVAPVPTVQHAYDPAVAAYPQVPSYP